MYVHKIPMYIRYMYIVVGHSSSSVNPWLTYMIPTQEGTYCVG